ncbi:MAG: nuclear transport factor 2 family protein [Lysobacteraceae bacterium]
MIEKCRVSWWLVLLAMVALASCSASGPEQRLRERIGDMQQALEAREPATFMRGVAEDFGGRNGLDRAGVHNLLRVQMLRHQAIGATFGPLDIEIVGDRATVKFTVLTTGGNGLIPERAQPWRVNSGWRDGSDGWQLIQADWE